MEFSLLLLMKLFFFLKVYYVLDTTLEAVYVFSI